jgi:hypothetical protein
MIKDVIQHLVITKKHPAKSIGNSNANIKKCNDFLKPCCFHEIKKDTNEINIGKIIVIEKGIYKKIFTVELEKKQKTG